MCTNAIYKPHRNCIPVCSYLTCIPGPFPTVLPNPSYLPTQHQLVPHWHVQPAFSKREIKERFRTQIDKGRMWKERERDVSSWQPLLDLWSADMYKLIHQVYCQKTFQTIGKGEGWVSDRSSHVPWGPPGLLKNGRVWGGWLGLSLPTGFSNSFHPSFNK